MRKMITALLCAVMCLTAFTGCSSAELGYLNTCRAMMDTMASCQMKGQTQMELDFDGLRGFAAAMEKETRTSGLAESLEGLTGKHTVLLDYDMKISMGSMAYSMDLDMTYQGRKYELGTLRFAMTEGMSVSSETLLGVYRLAKDMTDGMDGSYFFSDAFEQAWAAELGGRDIVLYTAEELGLSKAEMQEMMPQKGFGELYDAAFQFYEELLKGFDSGETLVKKIPGGYEIQADGKAVGRLIGKLLDFFAENPEQVLNAAESYIIEVAKQMEEPEAEQEMRALFDGLKEETEEMAQALREASAMWKETMQGSAAELILGSIRYHEKITGGHPEFTTEGGYEIVYNGAKIFSITSKAEAKQAAGPGAVPDSPKTGLTLDEVSAGLEKLTEEFNPAAGAALTWGFESTATQAMLETHRQESAPFDIGGGSTLEDLVIRDGRAYVPLRAICDTLGETVTWNKAERKAYIAKDGKDIAMDGILEGGKSFVGVREFEKLGYTVSYRSVDGLKEAVITR